MEKKHKRTDERDTIPFSFQSRFSPPVCNVRCEEHCLRAESILAARERTHALHGADALGVLLLGSERTTHGAGETRAQVERDVLLALVELAQLLSLSLVDDRQDARNVLAGRADLHELCRGAASHLRNTKGRKLRFEIVEQLEELGLALGAQFCRLHLRHFLSQKKHKKKGQEKNGNKKKVEKKRRKKQKQNSFLL